MSSLPIALKAGTVETVRRHTDIHQAWQRCCQSFGRYFAVRIGGDSHAVDDLMQQLWLQANRQADGVRNDDPEPWMWRIAQNLLREHRRRQGGSWDRRLQADAGLAKELAKRLDREELPEAVLMREETRQQLLLALTELAAADQELLIGFYYEAQSQTQVAASLGISERAVEGRLYRARKALRDRLERLNVEYDS